MGARAGNAVPYRSSTEDAAADRLERRWFAAFHAASVARAECEALIDQMERVEMAWNHARVRLAEIEAIRDALGDELNQLHDQRSACPGALYRAATAAA
jgi:hypothetical protein